MRTLSILLTLLLFGVALSAQGWPALLWFPLGWGLNLFISAQIVLPILMGIPRAVIRVYRGMMRPAVFGWLLLTPLAWSVGLFALGFFFPRAAEFLASNSAFQLGSLCGFVAIIVTPLSTAGRADFAADFEDSYGRFYKTTQQEKSVKAAITVAS